jgi:VanZ family protein
MLFLFIASVTPPPPVKIPGIWQLDKLFHFTAYFILGFLWARVLRATNPMLSPKNGSQLVLPSFVNCFLYGFFIEICQYFLPYREFSIFDMAANGLGGFLGSYIYCRLLIRDFSL